MKTVVFLLFMVSLAACEKATFDINPNRIYTPSEINKKAKGKCNQKQPWEENSISVMGNIDQISLKEGETNGKFWLRDEKTRDVIEIYVKDASLQEAASIYSLVKKSFLVTVTGKAVASEMPTQLKCTKGLHIEINTHTAIKP